MSKWMTGFLFMILGAVFVAAFAAPQKFTQLFFGKLLAQVGITVGVAPNPYNSLDAQLNAKQAELDRRQADLAARQAALASSSATNAAAMGAPALWSLALGVSGLALFLVGLNFYLDWKRSRKAENSPI